MLAGAGGEIRLCKRIKGILLSLQLGEKTGRRSLEWESRDFKVMEKIQTTDDQDLIGSERG